MQNVPLIERVSAGGQWLAFTLCLQKQVCDRCYKRHTNERSKRDGTHAGEELRGTQWRRMDGIVRTVPLPPFSKKAKPRCAELRQTEKSEVSSFEVAELPAKQRSRCDHKPTAIPGRPRAEQFHDTLPRGQVQHLVEPVYKYQPAGSERRGGFEKPCVRFAAGNPLPFPGQCFRDARAAVQVRWQRDRDDRPVRGLCRFCPTTRVTQPAALFPQHLRDGGRLADTRFGEHDRVVVLAEHSGQCEACLLTSGREPCFGVLLDVGSVTTPARPKLWCPPVEVSSTGRSGALWPAAAPAKAPGHAEMSKFIPPNTYAAAGIVVTCHDL